MNTQDQDRVDVTLRVPKDVMQNLDRVSALSGVPAGDVFNVLLATYLVSGEGLKTK